jgi:hypothetical protein
MSRVALDVMKVQLAQFDVQLNETLDDPDPSALVQVFKDAWADNGDALSRHYTGTDSTMSAGTRNSGSMLSTMFSAGYNSVKRFVNGMTDGSR